MNRTATLRSGPSQWQNVTRVFIVRFSYPQKPLAVGVDLVDHSQIPMAPPRPEAIIDGKRPDPRHGDTRPSAATISTARKTSCQVLGKSSATSFRDSRFAQLARNQA
jgi:hypothetical protein